MNEVLLEGRDIKKTFFREKTEIPVLKGVDFGVQNGDSIAIVGASGSGKSTLLHIIGALDQPTAGDVFFAGKPFSKKSEQELCHFRNRELGFVFQFHHLLPEFNALENTMMPALIARVGEKKAKERARAVLDLVGLSERIDHHPGELSGGEQQRVAIARAVIMEPKILLADEPTGNLDRDNSAKVMDLLLNLREQRSMALVVVTHDHSMAEGLQKQFELVDGMMKTLTKE